MSRKIKDDVVTCGFCNSHCVEEDLLECQNCHAEICDACFQEHVTPDNKTVYLCCDCTDKMQ